MAHPRPPVRRPLVMGEMSRFLEDESPETSPQSSPQNLIKIRQNWDLPSGYVKIAIENGHRNSGFTH